MNFFAALYQDPGRLRQFLHAMTGISMGAALAIAEKFPWERHHSVIDIGAAEGCVPVQLPCATRISRAVDSTCPQRPRYSRST